MSILHICGIINIIEINNLMRISILVILIMIIKLNTFIAIIIIKAWQKILLWSV